MSFFSYRGAPQPSPARSRYTPRGSIVQQPGDYAQHSGISHPGGAGFVSEAPQGARLRQAEYVWFPLYRFSADLSPPGDLLIGFVPWIKMAMDTYPARNCVCAPLSNMRSDSGLIIVTQVALF